MAVVVLLPDGCHLWDRQGLNGPGPPWGSSSCTNLFLPWCGEIRMRLSHRFTPDSVRLLLTLLGISCAGGGMLSDPVGSAHFLLMEADPGSWWSLWLRWIITSNLFFFFFPLPTIYFWTATIGCLILADCFWCHSGSVFSVACSCDSTLIMSWCR